MGVFLQDGDGRGSELESSGEEPGTPRQCHVSLHTRGSQQAIAWSSDLRKGSRVTLQSCFLDPGPLSLLHLLPSVPVASPYSSFRACLQISPVVIGFTGRPCFLVFCRYCISYKLKGCGNPVASKSISSIFFSNICLLPVSLSTFGNSHKILNFYCYFMSTLDQWSLMLSLWHEGLDQRLAFSSQILSRYSDVTCLTQCDVVQA